MGIKHRDVFVSYDTGSDTEGVTGLTTSSPLRTMTRAAAMYGKNIVIPTTIRLACGETWRERSAWDLDSEVLVTFEPWEKSPGDFDLLGRPRVTGGDLLVNWTANSGNWYSTDLAFGAASSTRVLMIDGVPQLRRDRRLTDAVACTGEMTPGTLAEGEWGFHAATGRIWVGSNPTGRMVELSMRDKPIVVPAVRNVTFQSLEFACVYGSLLSIDSIDGVRRRISILDMMCIGAGMNAGVMGGGDDICIRGSTISHGGNNVLTFNRGLAGHILVEDTDLYNPATFGTGPNGWYDDRTFNDCLTFHNDGGGIATVRRVRGWGAYENGLDIQGGAEGGTGWKRLYILDSEFSQAGQFVAVINAPSTILRTKFFDSARGVQFKFDNDTGPALGSQGSEMDQCIIVGNGNPAKGTVGNCSGLHYAGVTGSDEVPVNIARTFIIGHPDAQRPLLSIASRLYPLSGGVTVQPDGLKFTNCMLDNLASQALMQIGTAATPVSLTAFELLGSRLNQRDGATPAILHNDAALNFQSFMKGTDRETSSIGSWTYYGATSPTTPEQVIDTAIDMAVAMKDLGSAPSLFSVGATA